MLEVIKERCPQNHDCPAVWVCPVNALNQDGFLAPTVDEDACILCGKMCEFLPNECH